MSSPIKSQYQATPWQPTVNTSASDSSDQQAAASDYDKVYGGTANQTTTDSPQSQNDTNTYPHPTLTTSYTTAPDLIPLPNTSGQSSGGTPPAVADPFNIQLGVLMSSQQSCLDATTASLNGYNTLVPTVQAAINSNSIFGQIVGSESYHPDNKYNSTMGTVGNIVTFDKLDAEGTNFAAAVIPQMEHLLQAIGGAVTAMGTFCALLDDAGQMYTATDAQSAFPPPSLMNGGIIPPGQGPTGA
jgi:hypothetical protein